MVAQTLITALGRQSPACSTEQVPGEVGCYRETLPWAGVGGRVGGRVGVGVVGRDF